MDQDELDQEDLDETAQEIQDEQQRLQAALTAPLPPSTGPMQTVTSSATSERDALLALMTVLTQRVDQVAKTSAEQFSRVEQVIDQMVNTMRLAQLMIAQQDQQQLRLQDVLERLEVVVSAQVKLNANMSEMIAALVAPQKA